MKFAINKMNNYCIKNIFNHFVVTTDINKPLIVESFLIIQLLILINLNLTFHYFFVVFSRLKIKKNGKENSK